MSSSQNRNVFQPRHTCLLAEHYGKKNTKTQNATFRRIMTNVPGIVPQPYPIVNYPGTFAIILRKVATPLFFKGVLIANPPIFRGTFFGEKNFGGIFFWRIFFGRPLDGRRTAAGRRSDSDLTTVGRPSDVRPTSVRRPSDKE